MKYIKPFEDFINESQKNHYTLLKIHRPNETKGDSWKGKNIKRFDVHFQLDMGDNLVHRQMFSVGVKDGKLDIKAGNTSGEIYNATNPDKLESTYKKKTVSPQELKQMTKQIEDMYAAGKFD